MAKSFAFVVILLLSNAALGQQSPALSKHAEKIKKQVVAFDPGTLLTVKVAGQPDISGALVSETDDSFDLEDSSTHQNVSLTYENVNKVKRFARKYGKSHGGAGRTVAEVGGAAVIVGLIIYVIVALHSGA